MEATFQPVKPSIPLACTLLVTNFHDAVPYLFLLKSYLTYITHLTPKTIKSKGSVWLGRKEWWKLESEKEKKIYFLACIWLVWKFYKISLFPTTSKFCILPKLPIYILNTIPKAYQINQNRSIPTWFYKLNSNTNTK